MQAIYEIGGHRFVALDVRDATFSAIARARAMMRSGQPEAARQLFEEAVRLRRELQGPPVSRASARRGGSCPFEGPAGRLAR